MSLGRRTGWRNGKLWQKAASQCSHQPPLACALKGYHAAVYRKKLTAVIAGEIACVCKTAELAARCGEQVYLLVHGCCLSLPPKLQQLSPNWALGNAAHRVHAVSNRKARPQHFKKKYNGGITVNAGSEVVGWEEVMLQLPVCPSWRSSWFRGAR